MLPDTVRHTASSTAASLPWMRRRRRASGRLDKAILTALRDLLTPPAESEADAARSVAAIMARIPRGRQSAPARTLPRLTHP